MVDTGLAGKVALITGANRPAGIGAVTALRLAAQGARIFIAYHGVPSVDDVIRVIENAGSHACAVEADLADPASIVLIVDHAERALGPVNILVNNAAAWVPDSFLDYPNAQAGSLGTSVSVDSHDRHFAANSRAAAMMMAEYAHRHIERGARWGRIINISTDGAPGFPGEVSYGASKAALESYSRAAAVELGRYGITVNIVAPGPIQTGWIPAEREAEIALRSPLGRLGHPEDVADVIVFLASEQARWLTGQTLFAGGGHRMI